MQLKDSILNEKYSMLHSLNILFIPNVMSKILHDIMKLSEQFHKTNILSIEISVELSQL